MKYLFLPLLALIGCSSQPKIKPTIEKPALTQQTKQPTPEDDNTFVTDIFFKRNGSTLSSLAKNEIRRLINRAKQAGKIDEVKLVTWGDKEDPKSEQKLVSKRNAALEEYIDTLNARIDVKKISMKGREADSVSSSRVIVTLENED